MKKVVQKMLILSSNIFLPSLDQCWLCSQMRTATLFSCSFFLQDLFFSSISSYLGSQLNLRYVAHFTFRSSFHSRCDSNTEPRWYQFRVSESGSLFFLGNKMYCIFVLTYQSSICMFQMISSGKKYVFFSDKKN